jgi:hypothetical protein
MNSLDREKVVLKKQDSLREAGYLEFLGQDAALYIIFWPFSCRRPDPNAQIMGCNHVVFGPQCNFGEIWDPQ